MHFKNLSNKKERKFQDRRAARRFCRYSGEIAGQYSHIMKQELRRIFRRRFCALCPGRTLDIVFDWDQDRTASQSAFAGRISQKIRTGDCCQDVDARRDAGGERHSADSAVYDQHAETVCRWQIERKINSCINKTSLGKSLGGLFWSVIWFCF